MLTVFIVLVAYAAVLLVWMLWLCLRPMTVSLTFDDGAKAHLTIAAPLLEKYGWRGAFNVCTDFCEPNPPTLTAEKLAILSLTEHPELRLNWDDCRELLRRGHEVYPHTCCHVNLEEVDRRGEESVVQHEIVDARRAYIDHLGVAPRFFCCPHLGWTPHVKAVIRANGMEMFNNGRPGMGRHRTETAFELLMKSWREGRRHVDLMFHGITVAEGGHDAFPDQAAFEQALQTVQDAVKTGKIRVVNYADAHFGPSRCAALRDRVDWFLKKVRRVVYRVFV